jgi:hypothetical protein
MEPINFKDLMADVGKLEQALAQVFSEAPPSKEKDALGQLMGVIKDARADAEKAYPEVNEMLKKNLQGTFDSLKKHDEELKRAKEEIEAKIQETLKQRQEMIDAATAVPPEVKVDRQFGVDLNDEFMAAFGFRDAAKTSTPPRDEGSIAKHWDESEEAAEISGATHPVPPPPATPAPATPGRGIFETVRKKTMLPKSAPPKSDGDAWEDLSQTDE